MGINNLRRISRQTDLKLHMYCLLENSQLGNLNLRQGTFYSNGQAKAIFCKLFHLKKLNLFSHVLLLTFSCFNSEFM